MTLIQIKKLNLPITPGCYYFYNKKGELLYIGKAANLKSRIMSYWSKDIELSGIKTKMVSEIDKIKWTETDSEIEALLLEANLIKKYQPPYNILLRDDKRFSYVKISLEDEIPSVSLTRKIDKTGKYFGPFISTEAVRQTLKFIRKIWPYCQEKRIKNKTCFYHQINLCSGICGGKITRSEYIKNIIKPIILFFEGKKKKIIREIEIKIKKLGKINFKKNYSKQLEELKKLQYLLFNIKKVLNHANVLKVSEKYASDIIELTKVLKLKKIPQRIEGYDIANIAGREAVGVMVVFTNGEANKSQYRRFKIKNVLNKANDIAMLKEVLDRRFKKNWPFPDLIIVDGGRNQLNITIKLLNKYKISCPVVAIAKGEKKRSALAPDKLFFPEEKNFLELSLASSALHLLKRVRDEAHRFAVSYHRYLRRKRFFVDVQ